MSTAEQPRALLKNYRNGNDKLSASVVLPIAADATQLGNSQLAQELEDRGDVIKRKQSPGKFDGTVSIGRPAGKPKKTLSINRPNTEILYSIQILPVSTISANNHLG